MQSISLGEKIKLCRQRLCLSQRELAEQMGVSPQAVSKWEHDRAYPDILSLYPLACILCVTTDALLTPSVEIDADDNWEKDFVAQVSYR